MVHKDIELVDNDYFRIPLVKPSRKIKFKGISFKNILSRWNEFRLERLKKTLAAKKENLVGMEFPGDKLVPGTQRERIEKKVERKTRAIAKLESKINFLEHGEHYTEEFVDSRAIKLKDLMMKNLVYNRDSLYSVTEQAAEEIMSNNSVDSIIDAETEKIGARVREILAEKAAQRKAALQTENQVHSEESLVPSVGDNPQAAPVEESVSNTETNEVINENMAGIDVIPVVSNDEVAAAIDSEMQKIKVSGNESTPAKVNKFINEDGTYRLRREDIDEDFRITRFDRSKLPIAETTPVEKAEEPEIPPFSTTAAIRKAPYVEAPRKALTAIVERTSHKFPEIVMPTIKESFGQENNAEASERENPVVVPERKPIRVKVRKVEPVEEPVIEDNQENGDLSALIARVNLLKAEKRAIDNMTAQAEQKANSVNSAHREMVRRLQDFANSLEADCNASYQTMSEVERSAATKEAQITAMIEIMASSGSREPEKVPGRVK